MSPSPEFEAVQSASPRDEHEVDFDELVEKARKAELKALKKAEKEMQRANADTAEREARKVAEVEGAPKKGSKLQFEGELDRSEVAAYLEAIVRGLRSGSLQFRREEESLALTPAERVDVSVKASSRKGREGVRFELEWRAPSESEGKLAIVVD
ncbi:MAG: amphi-Trp domain-containing protein [Myxococcota bacterium]